MRVCVYIYIYILTCIYIFMYVYLLCIHIYIYIFLNLNLYPYIETIIILICQSNNTVYHHSYIDYIFWLQEMSIADQPDLTEMPHGRLE